MSENRIKMFVHKWLVDNCWRYKTGVDLANAAISKFNLERYNWVFNDSQYLWDLEYEKSLIEKYKENDSTKSNTIN